MTGGIRFLFPPGDLDLGRVVVFLDPKGMALGAAEAASGADASVRIVSDGPRFSPPLVGVPWKRSVVLVNEGPVNHRLFAAALGRERAFELAPGGRSGPFRLPPVGPIRFFCSLHADETFVVFAGRTPYVAVIEGRERFSFDPVAPGRYMLSIWSERVEGPVREVLVDGYSRRREDVWIDPRLVRSSDAIARGPR